MRDVQDLWADPVRWPNIVDGFGAVAEVTGGWPEGGRVVWNSSPHGRGRVIERAVEWSDGVSVVDVEDERIRATQTTLFEEDPEGVKVTLTLQYSLKDGNPVANLVDLLFTRRIQRDSLRRALGRLDAERRGDLSL